MKKLQLLEDDTIKMLKSVPQICRRPAQLWSTGKDSTLMLHLVRKAYGYIPWPIIHIDTGKKFKEIYEFREKMRLRWNIPLLIAKNDSAMEMDISPDTVSRYDCCSMLKTEALKQMVMAKRFDALILSIRHDEHYVRGMEDLVSLRDEAGNWQYWSRFGGFGLTAPEKEGYNHIRVHAILPWTEAEVWEYSMVNNLPVNPLYFAKQAEDGKWYRYRSLGCMPCTEPLESKATTIQEIVNEVYMTPGLERSGRMQDKETETAMLKLRQWGYM